MNNPDKTREKIIALHIGFSNVICPLPHPVAEPDPVTSNRMNLNFYKFRIVERNLYEMENCWKWMPSCSATRTGDSSGWLPNPSH